MTEGWCKLIMFLRSEDLFLIPRQFQETKLVMKKTKQMNKRLKIFFGEDDEAEGISKKAESIEEDKLKESKDPWVPRDWDTRTHLKKARP
ncbi:hypothetical protein AVEN_146355-1 [Araneus ventricosus]|uniref:Uncharacterized protein n=1 Tax=Araneus ventricosus TaxID=182803 RepID=A0A4Y2UTZ4_ARAVE|nr:hypothetical protein AVEN_146355-1 [Araneus ventricosus]